jgi:hydroxymethylglutaryl-CoA reductase (NADPH)
LRWTAKNGISSISPVAEKHFLDQLFKEQIVFPSSLLSRLFVKGSLKNTSHGFVFTLKNVIESGTITGMGKLTVDETIYEPDQVTIRIAGNTFSADKITRTNPVLVRSMVEIHMEVRGSPLSPGSHKMTVQVITAEAGKIAFSVTEPVAE